MSLSYSRVSSVLLRVVTRTQRTHNTMLMSSLRQNDIATSFWRYNDVIIASRVHWISSLQWRHNERDGVSNHRCLECLLNRLLRPRSKKTSKLRVPGLREGNPPATGGFPSQRASKAEKSFHLITSSRRTLIARPAPWDIRLRLSQAGL